MRSITLAGISVVALAAMSQPVLGQRGGGGGPAATCRPANEYTAQQVTHYQNVVTSSDSLMVGFRQRQQLPAVAASQISYVTDNAICAKVEAPYSAGLVGNGITPSLQVYVIKIGTVYVVWDPVQRQGEFQTFMTISNKYKVLVKRAG